MSGHTTYYLGPSKLACMVELFFLSLQKCLLNSFENGWRTLSRIKDSQALKGRGRICWPTHRILVWAKWTVGRRYHFSPRKAVIRQQTTKWGSFCAEHTQTKTPMNSCLECQNQREKESWLCNFRLKIRLDKTQENMLSGASQMQHGEDRMT